MKQVRCKGIVLVLLSLVTLLLGALLVGLLQQTQIYIHSGWQYRWRTSQDSPSGRPVWIETTDRQGWETLQDLRQPPDWDGVSELWLKVRLPPEIPDHMIVYLTIVRQNLECWLEGQLIYRYGSIPVPIGQIYNPWFPVHLLQLPGDAAGKELFFRIHSAGPQIGIGMVRLESLPDFLRSRARLDFVKVAIGSLCFFAGILALGMALQQKQAQSYFAFAGCALCNGILVLSGSFVINLLGDSYQYYMYAAMAGGLFWQFFWIMFLASIVDAYQKLIYKLRNLGFIAAVSGMTLLLIDSTKVHLVLNVGLGMLLSNFILLIYTCRGYMRYNSEAQIYAAGAIVWILTIVLDTLWGMGINVMPTPVGAFGQFIDIVCQAVILIRRFAAVHSQKEEYAREIASQNNTLIHMNDQISHLNFHLEEQVAQRTVALENTALRLQSQNEMLARQEKARRYLVSNIAHDLRTPMTMIQGYVEAILDGVAFEPARQRKSLQIIHEKTMALNRLIQNLFELSQLEARALELNKRPVNMGVFLRKLQASYEKDAASYGIHLVCDTATGSEKVAVNIDQNRMERVFANLIYNALRYTPREGLIRVSAARNSENQIILSVSDTGTGIDSEELELIFDRFYTGDQSRKYGGGLGLAIAREIVEMHGGRIWAESVQGQGSIFHIALPLSKS